MSKNIRTFISIPFWSMTRWMYTGKIRSRKWPFFAKLSSYLAMKIEGGWYKNVDGYWTNDYYEKKVKT